jgi:hypothetical protein
MVVLWFVFGVLVSILIVLLDWLWGNRIAAFIIWWRVAKIHVLDNNGNPVHEARVIVRGQGRHWTNKRGYARVYIPRADMYFIQVDYPAGPSRRSTNEIEPGRVYICRQNGGFHLSSLDAIKE